MKTWNQLEMHEKDAAVAKATDRLVEGVIEGAITFQDDSSKNEVLQRDIDAAIHKVNSLRTPWFAAEAIMEKCKARLGAIGQEIAVQAFYPEPCEDVIRGILR